MVVVKARHGCAYQADRGYYDTRWSNLGGWLSLEWRVGRARWQVRKEVRRCGIGGGRRIVTLLPGLNKTRRAAP